MIMYLALYEYNVIKAITAKGWEKRQMKAVVIHKAGGPENLIYQEVPKHTNTWKVPIV